MHALDGYSQQGLQKFANAAERAMSARDLLFQENSDLFKQNNESTTPASTKSIVVGKARFISFEDITETRKKRDKKDAATIGRRGRKRKNSTSTPAHFRVQKSRAKEVEEANYAINATGMRRYCSVLSV
jgi:hypothetical protein